MSANFRLNNFGSQAKDLYDYIMLQKMVMTYLSKYSMMQPHQENGMLYESLGHLTLSFASQLTTGQL